MSDFQYDKKKHGKNLSFNKFLKDEDFIHYEVDFDKLDENDLATKPTDSTVKYFYWHHWFYNPEKDIFFVFSTSKELTKIDSLYDKDTMPDTEYCQPVVENKKAHTFAFPDAPPKYEEFLMRALRARLEHLGYDGGLRILKPKKNANGRYRLKFMSDADYASFKLAFNEFIC